LCGGKYAEFSSSRFKTIIEMKYKLLIEDLRRGRMWRERERQREVTD